MRQHGTRAKYDRDKCRCEPCREASSRYYKEWTANRHRPRVIVHNWPLQPLFDVTDTTEYKQLAVLTEISARTLHRAALRGLPDATADRAATRLGLHPSLIWPNWFDPYLQEQAA